MDALIGAVEQAAVALPEALIEAIANGIEGHSQASQRARSDALRAVAPVNAREGAIAVCNAWQASCPALPGAAVALALRSAARTVAEVRGTQTLELVWTGPPTTVPTRATRQALIDLTRSASKTLLLTSFSAYRDQGVLDELNAAAVERFVEIILILETSEDSRGALSYDARHAFDELHPKAAFYVWPAKNRPVGGGYLHAKVAVADRLAAIITSANLSAAALDRNMELGLLVTGGPLPQLLEQHFRSLIAQRVLVPVNY